MKKKILMVKAFKYDDTLFNTIEEVKNYIQEKKDHKKMMTALADEKRLKTPMTHTIKAGMYYSFLVVTRDKIYRESERVVCYRRTSFLSALNSVLKRKGLLSIDYEAEILNVDRYRTGVMLDLNNMPKTHPVHEYI